jgi:hypothetical protein
MRKLKAHTMKIITVLAFLMIIIIVSGILSTKILESNSNKLASKITEIQKSIAEDNWAKSSEQMSLMKKDWSGMEGIWTILLDHFELDNIDTSLSRLEKFIEIKDRSQTLSETATLKQYFKHIPEKEAFNLKNIF